MATDFNAKPFLKTANPYFLQWGLHFPMLEAKYYERMTGIKADHYVPYALLSQFLIPFLNGTEPTLDKNDLRKMFGATLPNKRVPFLMAEQVVYNKGGIFYDGNDECIPVDEAVRLVMKYDKDIIMKPTVDTTWGKGVAKFCLEDKNEKEIEQLFAKYGKDFSFEECVQQHSDMSKLNPTSLNTTRVVTYRKPDGQLKMLFALQRFGKADSVVDNASAGGQFVGVAPDGTLNRFIKSYKSLEKEQLPDYVAKKIPFFDRIKDAALYLHSKMPNNGYLGWDFSINQAGVPVLIELNLYPAVYGTQIATGPAFSREDLDELMPLLAKWRVGSRAYPRILFDNKMGHGGQIY